MKATVTGSRATIDWPTSPAAPQDSDFDLDAALLPEDSWDPDEDAGIHEVEEVLDVRLVKRTRTSKQTCEYLIKWVRYDETAWIPVNRLNCEKLLYEFDQTRRAMNRYESMQTADELPDSQ